MLPFAAKLHCKGHPNVSHSCKRIGMSGCFHFSRGHGERASESYLRLFRGSTASRALTPPTETVYATRTAFKVNQNDGAGRHHSHAKRSQTGRYSNHTIYVSKTATLSWSLK